LTHAQTRHDSLFQRLERSGRDVVTMEIDFNTKIIAPSIMNELVKNCAKLREITFVGMVSCEENDLMTPLSQLQSLRRVSIKSNIEAFAPSFTCEAISRWVDLESFQCEQIVDALPNKNHNKDYEYIDFPTIVSTLAQYHSGTLRSLKIHFPLRLRPVNSTTGETIRLITNKFQNLERLWLNKCVAEPTDIFILRKLTQLFSLDLDVDHGIWPCRLYPSDRDPMESLLFEGEENVFPSLRHVGIIFEKNSRKEKKVRKRIAELESRLSLSNPDRPFFTISLFPAA